MIVVHGGQALGRFGACVELGAPFDALVLGVLIKVRLEDVRLGMPQSACKLAPCIADEESISLHSQSLNL
jgi:hypothetical protein